MYNLSGRFKRFIPPIQKMYFQRFAIGLIILLVVARFDPFGRSGIDSIYLIFGGAAYAFGYSPYSIASIVFASIPTFVFCYLFSDYLKEGLSRTASYVFTRSEKRGSWLFYRMLQLTGFTLLYSLLGTVITIALFVVGGIGFQSTTLISALPETKSIMVLLLMVVLLYTATLLLLLFLINVLSLHYEVVTCFIAVMACHCASLFICSSASSDLASFWAQCLPTIQGIFAWHDLPVNHVISGQRVIVGFSLLQSSGYLCVIFAEEIIAAFFTLKNLKLY